jgi:hypothetical protein
VNWTTIKPESLKNTVWDGIDDESIKLDEPRLQDLFSIKEVIKSSVEEKSTSATKS